MQESHTQKGTYAQSHTQHLGNTHLGEGREPIVVTDQYGIVISWSDKHTSRFFWSELRESCSCKECRAAR